jgi:hypothetical protein
VNNLIKLGHLKLIIIIAIVILSLAALSLVMMRRSNRVGNAFVRREVFFWSVLSLLAVFLLFSISAPFYALLGPLSQIVFPWRMQNIFMLSLTFLLAVWMQWFVAPERMKTWKGDYGMLLALLILTAHFLTGVRDDSVLADDAKIVAVSLIAQPEYRSIWTDEKHFNLEYIVSRNEHKESLAAIVSGKGDVKVDRWAWDGIILKAHSAHGLTVRLTQYYFPVWSAQADDGERVTLHPEEPTGQMLLDIPAGKHRIVLRYAVSTDNPGVIWFADAVSALAALILLGMLYQRRNTISLL